MEEAEKAKQKGRRHGDAETRTRRKKSNTHIVLGVAGLARVENTQPD